MAGTYQIGQKKELSGVYSAIVAALTAVESGERGIVAYPFTADWGPVNELREIYFETDLKESYNAENSALTVGRIYTHAFKGKPSLVLGYRMAAPEAAKATATLTSGWVLETRYPTDRPFMVKVTDALAGGKSVEVTENGVQLFKVEGADPAALTAAINTTDFLRVRTEGKALPENNAGLSFTGGNNGAAVTAVEYADFRESVEADLRAKAIALDSYTDPAEVAATVAWTKRVRDEGLYITFVNGGPLSWDNDLDAANVVSKGYNYRGIINVGNGVDGYSAAEMAIFVAARAASVALNRQLTDETVPYSQVNKKLTKSPRITAKKAGTLIFVQRGDLVEIDEGVNTFTTVTDPTTQKKEMGKIRVSNTLDQIATDTEAFGEAYKKDKSNTPEARETYAATIEESYFGPLVGQQVIQAGATYRPDEEYHGANSIYTAKIDEAYFTAAIQPVDGMEKVYQKIGVSFN